MIICHLPTIYMYLFLRARYHHFIERRSWWLTGGPRKLVYLITYELAEPIRHAPSYIG